MKFHLPLVAGALVVGAATVQATVNVDLTICESNSDFPSNQDKLTPTNTSYFVSYNTLPLLYCLRYEPCL